MEYNFFAYQNFDKMCTSNLMGTLSRFQKFRTWFNQFFQKTKQIMKILYIWTKIILVTKYEKWKIYFKSEVIGDCIYKKLGEEWQ
jgi:hypothetical protein